MLGFCGIDIDKDKIFICFANKDKDSVNFLEEVRIDSKFQDLDFLTFLKNNIEIIKQKIIEKRNIYLLDIEKIFLNLTLENVNECLVEEIIPFRRVKKITFSDIVFAKKYLEESALEWDDVCIHHFVFSYSIDKENYFKAPLGVMAKKIKLKSLLIYIKNSLYESVSNIFDSVDLEFGGFVYEPLSSFSLTLKEGDSQDKIVINIGYEKSSLLTYLDGIFDVKEFDFGLIKIFNEIEKKFSVLQTLAKNIFERYISFKESPAFKEITLKDGELLISLNINTFNTFIKEYIKNEISIMIEKTIENLSKKDIVIFFTGRLNLYDGFCEFIKENIPHKTEVITNYGVSSSFGCIRYGLYRYLETDKKKSSIFTKIFDVFKEYF